MQSPTKKQKKDDSTTKIVGYLVSNVKLNGWNKWSIKTKPEEVVTVFLNNEESWMKGVLIVLCLLSILVKITNKALSEQI